MRKFHKAIFFTKVPITGFYRFNDVFQIYPAEMKKIPKSKLQAHFPNIIEFWTTDEENLPIPDIYKEFGIFEEWHGKYALGILKQDKIYSLLSTFTNNEFFIYKDISGIWGYPILSEENELPTITEQSKWCMPLFNYKGLGDDLRIDRFTELAYPEINKIDHLQYYLHDPNLDFNKGEPIILPKTIDKMFESYYSLKGFELDFVNTACDYINTALELRTKRKTFSLIAAFTAIETMVNLENLNVENKRCTECGQPVYSVSKKFRDYLLKYIGDLPSNKKKFNDLYSLRSKIVHTGIQLKTEKLFVEIPEEIQEKEHITRIEILQIAKLSITNWLLLREV
jgi:hypothetical protein